MIWKILKWCFSMVQGLKSKIAIIGGGPAGCFCAYLLQRSFDVTVFDFAPLLSTIIPTGGGRCNLAYAQYDYKELAKNYPRGEKFLYSVFSKFSTADTINFFEEIGVKTYVQDDLRIFPTSNSAKNVRKKFLAALDRINYKKERVLRIDKEPLTLITDCSSYIFDKVIIAAGGHSGYDCAKLLGHNIIEPKPSLTALKTKENFSSLAGVSIQKAEACGFADDILFTHNGISGPLVYKISSIKARDAYPYKISFDIVSNLELQAELNSNPHKTIKNLLGEFVPKSFSKFILTKCGINSDKKCCEIDGKTRDKILDKLHNFTVTITAPSSGGEVVTAGGVNLREINSKTMESKLVPNVYFCGEVMDIDGFCGGFNLQNCWSTAYCAAQAILT